MRTGLHRNTYVQVLIGEVMILSFRGRFHLKQFHPLAIQQQLDIMLIVQTFDVFVTIALQTKLDVVRGVQRESVAEYGSTAGAERKLVKMLFLRQVWRKVDGIAAGRT